MAYDNPQKKKSQFTTDDTISNASTFDFVKAGINKKTSWSNIKARLAEVFGLSVRLYETESAMVADTDLELGDHAIVEENRYMLYEVTNVSAGTNDVTLSNGLIAGQQGNMVNNKVADYTELRALRSTVYADGDIINVTNDGIAGQFIVKTGTVTDNGGTRIVFTDDSNRYVERAFDGSLSVKWFGAVGDSSTDDQHAFAAAQTASVDGYLEIPYSSSGDYYIDTDLTINEGTTLVFNGGKIRLAAGNKILLYGSIEAGTYDHIFHITDYETNIRWLNGQDLLATWYGAVGDNDSANESANHLAFQVAIYSFQNNDSSSVAQETRPYGVVRIPRGRYVLNTTVWQSSTGTGSTDPNAYGSNIRGVSIVGDGFASTRIAYSLTDTTTIAGLFRFSGALACKMSDIYLSSNVDFGTFPLSTAGKTAFIFDKGGNEVFFERVRVQQFEIGALFNNIKDCFLTDVTIDGCMRHAIDLRNNASVHLANCDLFRNAQGDYLVANSGTFANPTIQGVIGLKEESSVPPNFLMLTNCHIGLGNSGSNIIYSEGTANGVHMNNVRCAKDEGDGEFNIKAKDTTFYVENCDFFDFGLNLIQCDGHFKNCRMGKSKVWEPGSKEGTGLGSLTLEGIRFYGESNESVPWLQVNVGLDYEGNAGVEGKIRLISSEDLSRTTGNYCSIQECEYILLRDNYANNADGTRTFNVSTDVTNAQVMIQGNVHGEFSVSTDSIYVEGDNTYMVVITGNEVSRSTNGVTISGTHSGSWTVANNSDTTVI